MSFREIVEENEVKKIGKEVSKKLEASGILYELDGEKVLFENVKESEFRVAGNVFSKKEFVADALGVKREELMKVMSEALRNPSKPKEVSEGACQEVEVDDVDLDKLPILFHVGEDGGNYVTSGVIIAGDKELGQNVSFHRCMQIGKNRFSVRILPRHLNELIEKNGGELDVALCVGCDAQVLLAGATSTDKVENELEIANSMKEFEVVKAKTVDVMVPAECEFVLEGRILKENAKEGPFVDLTETYDIVREQPVFEVRKITHRKDAIWHALLPGGLEHKVLMGMPREPTIFEEVNKMCKCLEVNINSGGCSWLHAIVKIDKQGEDDGKKAISAAFKGHSSLKHCFVVDKDVDVYDSDEVEWAFATRFQGDKDLVVMEGEKGSSLDPSANPETRETCKLGFDLTAPLGKEGDFRKAEVPKVDLKKYLE